MRIVRLTLMVVLSGLFIFLAFYLYDRQKNQYSYLSFNKEEYTKSIMVPNFERLTQKISSAEEITALTNTTLISGLNTILGKSNFSASTYIGESVFAAFNHDGFVLAFAHPDFSYDAIEEVLSLELNLSGQLEGDQFILEGVGYETAQFDIYTVFSNQPIEVGFPEQTILPTNADLVVFEDSSTVERFIIERGQSFKVWSEDADPVRGAPVVHKEYIKRASKGFDAIVFYGSQRLLEDKMTLFNAPGEEAFSWMADGLMLLKKDSFELMLAPQNDQRDLKLILEEQTLAAQGDSGLVNYFSVKNFEIMPFETNFNWEDNIEELNSHPAFYTEFENYNVLANSLAAMRWYLSEIQTGNLIGDDRDLMALYENSTPLKAHYLVFANEGEQYYLSAALWPTKTKKVITETVTTIGGQSLTINPGMAEFALSFDPEYILPMDNSLLLVNAKKMESYSLSGEKEWAVNFSGALLEKPSLIDLENNGEEEIAVFTPNGFTVYNSKTGQNIESLTIALECVSGGLIANYDNKFDYRFFITAGTKIHCYNESGAKVEGWTFAGGTGPFTGENYYTQIGGKDYLVFENKVDGLYALNRRGEARFGTVRQHGLTYPSTFITGTNEADLMKLGYRNQYILNYFIKDGGLDSVKLDKRVNAVRAEWVQLDEPKLLIEEPERVILFNAFGYVEQEILKPLGASKFVGLEVVPQIYYVFFDNSNNSLYLLDRDGKMILTNLSNSPYSYGINSTRFYTFDGQKLKEHKLN